MPCWLPPACLLWSLPAVPQAPPRAILPFTVRRGGVERGQCGARNRTSEVPSCSLDPAHSTQSVPVQDAGGELSQFSVSHTTLACSQLGAQPQTSGTAAQSRFYRNFEPRQSPTPRYKAHQKHSQTPLPSGPMPITTQNSVASAGYQDSLCPWLKTLINDQQSPTWCS